MVNRESNREQLAASLHEQPKQNGAKKNDRRFADDIFRCILMKISVY